MALKLLPNTAAYEAARVTITNDTDTSAGDELGIESITGGPRWLSHVSGTTGNRRYVYLNKTAGISCGYVVVTDADRHNNHGAVLKSWSSYPSTSTDAFTVSGFAETLVGPTSRDWYRAFSVSGVKAVALELSGGTGGAYTKTVGQIFFSTPFALDKPGQPVRQYLPFPTRHYFKRRMFLIQEQISLSATDLTLANIQSFERIPKLLEEPMFLLDESGVQFPEKLLHVIISGFSAQPITHDLFNLNLSLLVLRYHR